MRRLFSILACLLFLHTLPAHAQDMIPVDQVQFVGPGGNVGAFPSTARISQVSVDANGTNVTFDKGTLPSTRGGTGWPDTCVPFGGCKEPGIDMGALQYSFGLVLKVNGQWVGSAPIENWYGRMNGTGPLQDQTVSCPTGTGQIHCNLFYDSRWPLLNQVTPRPGDTIGVFVVAGDARNNFFVTQERSNIVTIQLPATGQTQTFNFDQSVPTPPVPVPAPTPVPVPPTPLPSTDTAVIPLLQQIVSLQQ